MWLTGHEIMKSILNNEIKITPFHETHINPNSYNYTLYPILKRITNNIIDLKGEDEYEELEIPKDGLILEPGECYLGCTNEVFSSDIYASLVTGRSSIGRKFVTNHITAGLIDQGFNGRITLEITVQKKTIIYPYIPFGQIFWFSTVGDPLLYEGKYQLQDKAITSKISLEKFKAHKIYIIPVKTKCNAKCNFCMTKKTKNNFMDIKKVRLDTFKNIDRVEITGGGEPFLHKDLDILITRVKETLSPYIKLYTNGYIKKPIPFVAEINISRISFDDSENTEIYGLEDNLIKTLIFFRPYCLKLRICIPMIRGRIDTEDKVKELHEKLSPYVDEIVLRPLSEDTPNLAKIKPKEYPYIKIPKVKYDIIECADCSLSVLVLGADGKVHKGFNY